ncbi:protein kinase [Achlya hypogyna]|uniref:Protein kinase n=1 Tax=Achlya hypogyna TaxID=1202772 RepID=A0A1V9YM08_ACHHY|nr:protein kinase [Achlya hypogyna]
MVLGNLQLPFPRRIGVSELPCSSEPPKGSCQVKMAAPIARLVPVVHGIEYGVACFLAVASIAYLRQQRFTAWRGNHIAARKILLPSFEPVLWGFTVVSGAYAIYFAVALSVGYNGPGAGQYQYVYNELIYEGEHFNVVFVGVFLYQKSVSLPAMLRALLVTLILLGSSVVALALISTFVENPRSVLILQHVVAFLARGGLCAMFLRLAWWPMARANAVVLRELCAFALVFYGLGIVYTYLFYRAANTDSTAFEVAGLCVLMASSCWVTLAPVFIWRVLKADTEHWRGLTMRACAIACRPDTCVQEVVSAEGLHLLLELHRHDLVDFAHLEWHGRLGVGGSATVYRGTLHSTIDVAIKVYSPPEITEAVVSAFSQEAGLWSILRHPNIVTFYGMCVCPPTIGLVSELCRGSLADLLAQKAHIPSVVQLCYMLDAARAVAYLHSFTPPLLHRDLKAANFLVDGAHTVKLSDFGESRATGSKHMSVRGTVEYMAPEMIDGKRGVAEYATGSDVYSLGMTFWDVLHPRTTKYPAGDKNHLHIFQTVLDGGRPVIATDVSLPLRGLLEAMWHPVATARPSAAAIVETLEAFVADECQAIVVRLTLPSVFTGAELVDALEENEAVGDKREAVRVGNACMAAELLHSLKHNSPFKLSSNAQFSWDAVAPRRSSLLTFRDSDEPCRCRQLGLGFRTKAHGRRPPFLRKPRPRTSSATAIELLLDPDTDDELWADPLFLRETVSATTLSPALAAAKAREAIIDQFKSLQLLYTLGYGTMFVLSVACVLYLRYNRASAFSGDSEAARKILLPSFEPLIWVMVTVSGAYTAYFIAASAADYTKPIFNTIFTELLYEGRQFILFLILAFLFQRSVSTPALWRSVGISFVIVLMPTLSTIILSATSASVDVTYFVTLAFRIIFALFLMWLSVYPLGRANPRAIREFCIFVLIYYALVFVYAELFHINATSSGLVIVFITVSWASALPFFVYRLLRADTQHWRGLGERACDLQQLFRQNQCMQEIVSAQGLHVLLEMHQRDIIDFAHLELQRKIGLGASADVYRGLLHHKTPVAIKVYSPTEITESTIVDFSQEAALCSALTHPNIVTFHGMCVLPPTICLVSELCRGSLEEQLAFAKRDYTEPLLPQLCYMIDAARAVAYLHSFSPPFIHRDIKPANFLMDACNVIKLTDFGESRSMAVKVTDVANPAARKMTMRGTADYMAPEVIDGRQGEAVYNETADVYSLGITFWDILHPGREKYPASKSNHMHVFATVLDGQRPPLDPELHPVFRDLLESTWCSNPEFRPSAAAIVSTLETFQEEMAGSVAHALAHLVQYSPATKSRRQPHPTFTGAEAVRCLQANGYAFEPEEAIRLGNALMDAGCIHHATHAIAFENSDASYYFDETHIDLVQLLPRDKRGTKASDDSVPVIYVSNASSSDGVPDDASATEKLVDHGRCLCRRHAQGHDSKPKVAKNKLFRRKKLDANNMLTVNLLTDMAPDDFSGFATGESVLSDPRKAAALTA